MPRLSAVLLALVSCAFVLPGPAKPQQQSAKTAQDSVPQELAGLPLVFSSDFEAADADVSETFDLTDATAWKLEAATETDRGQVLSQFKKSDYAPKHRSPLSIALVKEPVVGDFVLTARVRSTIPDYGHRDACVFFGHQDADNFYYVHFGKQTDDHANQIFIVNDAPRIKISTKTTEGTPWDDAWHQVKIVRDVESGQIEVYFDDMQQPVMTASNKEFAAGRIGFGSFDDTTQWDDIRLYGLVSKDD